MAAKDLILLGIGESTSPALTYFTTFGLSAGTSPPPPPPPPIGSGGGQDRPQMMMSAMRPKGAAA